MQIESQVCSLELAIILKELGIEIDSLFYWLPKNYNTPSKATLSMKDGFNKTYHDDALNALTVSELLDILPQRITIKNDTPFNSFRLRLEKSFHIENTDNIENLSLKYIYIVNYRCDATECAGEAAWLERTLTKNISDSNAANALAKLLIYLIENNLYKEIGNIHELRKSGHIFGFK